MQLSESIPSETESKTGTNVATYYSTNNVVLPSSGKILTRKQLIHSNLQQGNDTTLWCMFHLNWMLLIPAELWHSRLHTLVWICSNFFEINGIVLDLCQYSGDKDLAQYFGRSSKYSVWDYKPDTKTKPQTEDFHQGFSIQAWKPDMYKSAESVVLLSQPSHKPVANMKPDTGAQFQLLFD